MNLIILGAILLYCGNAAASHLTLNIFPLGRDVILEQNADLNLTCKVVTRGRKNNLYELSWKLPTRSNAPGKAYGGGDRITVYQSNDQLTVTIHNMQEDDTGLYVCKLQDNGIIWTRKISVFVRSKKCIPPLFDCGSGLCISKRYVCDGYVDCPSGYDEAFKYCGQDACYGKILCDGRCIPKDMCCDSNVDSNCSANSVMPCCQSNLHPGETNPSPCSSSESCRYSHYPGYGNSILYIVASCAAVVMVVSVVIMLLACRICSHHPEDIHHWTRVPTNGMHRQYLQGVTALRDSDSTDNIDFLVEDTNSDGYQVNSSSDTPDDFVLLNFVPGFGFEVADCGPKPPPYTENAIGIPPPPYESCSDISESNKNAATPQTSNSNLEDTP